MNKKYELISKYFSDLSKIWLTATVVKQFAEQRFEIHSFIGGIVLGLIFIISAIILQPKED